MTPKALSLSIAEVLEPVRRGRDGDDGEGARAWRSLAGSYAPFIERAATQFDLDPALIAAVAAVESAFNPTAESPKGALGVMQIMPATAADLGLENPFDAEQNIEAGARFLRRMLDRFNGDLDLALAAYNAGPDRIRGLMERWFGEK